MKRSWICLAAMLLLPAACAERAVLRLPEQLVLHGAGSRDRCEMIFPKGRWELVHSIDFASADGFSGSLIGVTVLAGEEIRTALITVEGVTLFEASQSGGDRPEIHRAVYPFDKPAFATGLLKDVRIIFLPPPSHEVHWGRLAGGVEVCRYESADGRVTDISPAVDGYWQITAYGAEQTRETFVSGQLGEGGGSWTETIELRSFLFAGYLLKMKLISAAKLP